VAVVDAALTVTAAVFHPPRAGWIPYSKLQMRSPDRGIQLARRQTPASGKIHADPLVVRIGGRGVLQRQRRRIVDAQDRDLMLCVGCGIRIRRLMLLPGGTAERSGRSSRLGPVTPVPGFVYRIANSERAAN